MVRLFSIIEFCQLEGLRPFFSFLAGIAIIVKKFDDIINQWIYRY